MEEPQVRKKASADIDGTQGMQAAQRGRGGGDRPQLGTVTPAQGGSGGRRTGGNRPGGGSGTGGRGRTSTSGSGASGGNRIPTLSADERRALIAARAEVAQRARPPGRRRLDLIEPLHEPYVSQRA